MNPFAHAIVQRLRGVEFLRANLSTYQNEAAVFGASSVPEDADYPYVWTPAAHSGNDADVKNGRIFTWWRDVVICTRDEGSDEMVDALAEAVRAALHKRPLKLDDSQNVVLNAAPPIVAPTADGVLGRIVQLRAVISEA